jgi:hypothetical protein
VQALAAIFGDGCTISVVAADILRGHRSFIQMASIPTGGTVENEKEEPQ